MSVFSNPCFDGHRELVFHCDEHSGLRAIVAIHSLRGGAAMGGCRMYPYASEDLALEDVLRLSRSMSYKSALAGLPVGGGKAVIIGDPRSQKSDGLLAAMGRFVDSLGGRYITAEDSGIGERDLQIMARHTRHVVGIAREKGGGDPSPYTAEGVFVALHSAVVQHLGRSTLAGLRVAVQGAGAVGYELIRRLSAAGAELYVSDSDADKLQRAVALGARAVSIDKIAALDVEVFAPCAMGGAIHRDNIASIKARIIAGAANNQLAEPGLDAALQDRGIVYLPDFAVNAGGIIKVFFDSIGRDDRDCHQHIAGISDTLQSILDYAARHRVGNEVAAEAIARQRMTVETASGCAA